LWFYFLFQFIALKIVDKYILEQMKTQPELDIGRQNYENAPVGYRLLMFLSARDLQLEHISERMQGCLKVIRLGKLMLIICMRIFIFSVGYF